MTTRATGIALALVTAVVSGISIYVNGHAVRHFSDATVYTTAKNAVAGALLIVFAVTAGRGPTGTSTTRPSGRRQWLACVVVAVDRGQRAVRPLLRGPSPRRGDAGGVHPEDARGLGRVARRPVAPRAVSGGRTRSRIVLLDRRPGLAHRACGHDRLRDR